MTAAGSCVEHRSRHTRPDSGKFFYRDVPAETGRYSRQKAGRNKFPGGLFIGKWLAMDTTWRRVFGRCVQPMTLDFSGEITSASAEQRDGVAHVGEAVNRMDQATQQRAALIEQSAAAAESLKSQTQRGVQSVAVFKRALAH